MRFWTKKCLKYSSNQEIMYRSHQNFESSIFWQLIICMHWCYELLFMKTFEIRLIWTPQKMNSLISHFYSREIRKINCVITFHSIIFILFPLHYIIWMIFFNLNFCADYEKQSKNFSRFMCIKLCRRHKNTFTLINFLISAFNGRWMDSIKCKMPTSNSRCHGVSILHRLYINLKNTANIDDNVAIFQ